jgi:hypothetical protein
VLLLVEEGFAGLPDGLVSEENELIVHLNCCDEDGVLKVVAKIPEDGL